METLDLAIPCVSYASSVFEETEARKYYNDLHENIAWEKTSKINRWVSLYEESGDIGYKYRDAPTTNITNSSNNKEEEQKKKTTLLISSNPTISTIQKKVEQFYFENTGTKVHFNACLLNFYENGSQRIGWHCDREELGRSTPIASVSLGATRTFMIRHKLNGSGDRTSIQMKNGSCVFMENICQSEYLHSVPKEENVLEGRINLTFRCKTEETAGEEEHERRDRWLENIGVGNNNNENLFSDSKISMAVVPNNDDDDLSNNKNSSSLFLFGQNIYMGEEKDIYEGERILYAVTCNIGTEQQCGAELEEKFCLNNNKSESDSLRVVARPYGIAGYVALLVSTRSKKQSNDDATASDVVVDERKLLELRSVLNVVQYYDHFTMEQVLASESQDNNGMDDVKKVEKEMLYSFFKKRILDSNLELIPDLAAIATNTTNTNKTTTTFRVTSNRIGDHKFNSAEVEYEMGGAIAEVYEPFSIIPKMTDYDIHIRIDIICNKIMIGRQINVEDLSKGRHFLRYRNSVTLKSNLAYIMVRLANIQIMSGGTSTLVDPFCGSGTILLEALDIMKNENKQGGNNSLKCIGMDVNRRAVNGAKENAESEGYSESQCAFHCSDARGIRKVIEEDEFVDAIVSNLPWGVKTGHNQSVNDLQNLYEIFLRTSFYKLKNGGRIVMLVLRGLQMIRILRKLGGRYKILSVSIVRTTNNLPSLIVIEKIGQDLLVDSVKNQLGYMSQFVNFSKEMYSAINNETIDSKEIS